MQFQKPFVLQMVLILDPLNPNAPADDHDKALPNSSVIVTIVLLNVERMCATPFSIFFSLYVYEILVYVPFKICLLYLLFFLLATVLTGPLRVRALFFVFDHELVNLTVTDTTV